VKDVAIVAGKEYEWQRYRLEGCGIAIYDRWGGCNIVHTIYDFFGKEFVNDAKARNLPMESFGFRYVELLNYENLYYLFEIGEYLKK
jgi:hypothetical protein